MTEKRLFHRMNIKMPVYFETGDPKSLVMASTLDVSATGLSLLLKEPVTVGTILRVSLKMDEEKTACVDAQIVWVKEATRSGDKEYRAGLKVVDKMDQDEIEFVRFVARKMFDYFKPGNQK